MGGFSGRVSQRNIVAASAVAVSNTGTTSEVALATITLPILQPNSIVEVTPIFSNTNSAGTKTLRVRFGGIGGTGYLGIAATTSINTQQKIIIRNRGVTNSQVGFVNTTTVYGNTPSALVTSSVDTSVSTTIVISGQLSSGADTVTLESYQVEVINP